MKRRELTRLGADVKKALIDKRMTQVELAARLGIKKQYLNLILSGKRSGEKYLGDIVAILDLDPELYLERKSA